jgi:hypothetical protein
MPVPAGAWSGPDVYAFSLAAEQVEDLDGRIVRADQLVQRHLMRLRDGQQELRMHTIRTPTR